LSGGYLVACWNSQSTLAVPAQAIKSVYAAHLASGRDQSSNNYRVLENQNINFTIHQHPFTGIGFGQKFSMAVALPDLSRFFEWWEYITHNSIMWIWMKAGIGGFYSMLCLIGLAVVGGVRALDRLPRDDLRPVVLTATLYIVMHFIYACVDMSWDAGSTVYVGTMMGVVNCAEWIETQRQ
jgi:O-antigen ligase